MRRLSIADLKATVRTLDGRQLETLKRRQPFVLRIRPDGLEYTPESTGVPRRQPWDRVAALLDRFNERQSFSPGEYEGTRNASYFLAVVDATLKAQ